MANKSQITVLVVGDSSGAQKALKDVAAAAQSAAAETTSAGDKIAGAGEKINGSGKKVEGFGASFRGTFLEMGAMAAVGAKAADLVIETVKGMAESVGEYTAKMQESSATILAVTKDQGKLAEAMAFADQQAKAGRSAYSDTVAAIAELSPTAKRSHLDVLDLYKTVQLLSALNSGPDGGVSGAVVAINNALSGQFTSLQDRFNMSTTGIQKAIAAGVPPLEAINSALAKEGVTMDLVNAKSQTLANQTAILKDNFVRLAAEKTQDFFITVNSAVRELNGEITNESSVLHTLINDFKELQDTLGQVGKGGFGEAARGVDKGAAEFERSLLTAFRDLPNSRGANDPLTKWLQEQIDHYSQAIDAGKPYVELKTKELADAAAKGAQGAPVKAVEGFAPTPAQLAEAQQHGTEILSFYLKGLNSDQVDTVQSLSGVFADLFKDAGGKADTGKLVQGQTALAEAFRDTAKGGQLTNDTMLDLSASFGMQTPEVVKLVTAYNSMTTAQQKAKLAAEEYTAAQQRQLQVQYAAKGDLDAAQKAIDAANKASAQHAQEAADQVAPLQQRLKDVQESAAEAARAGAAQLQGMQEDLTALQKHASDTQAAYAAQIADAQAKAQAQTTRRTEIQGLLNAALKGETEEYLRQNDITDDSIRKIGEKWQAEIDGQRRAKDGANQAVTNLTRAQNKEDLSYIERINAARAAGNTKEAARLTKERDLTHQKHSGEMEEARARAAVANDNYDIAAENLNKEGKKQDETEAKAEKAATAEVTRIQSAAAEQKKADDAAITAQQDRITAVQKQQAADQLRSQDAQRNIQQEIDKVNEQAVAQAKKDKKAIDDAQTLYNNRKIYWDQEQAGAGAAAGIIGTIAGNQKTIADDSKTTYDNLVKISQIDFKNVIDAAAAIKAAANTPPPTPAPPAPSSQSPTPISAPPNATPGQTEGQIGAPADVVGPIDASGGGRAPAGYHVEQSYDGRMWFIPDGHTVEDYDATRKPTQRNRGDSGGNGLGRGQASLGLGVTSARSPLSTGGTPAIASVGDVHIHLPNVTNVGDKQQMADGVRAWRAALNESIRSGQGGQAV